MSEDPKLDELTKLLPFYVNGTLGNADRARIDSALHGSAALRAALADQMDIMDMVKDTGRRWAAEADRARSTPDLLQTRESPAPVEPASIPQAAPATLLAYLNPSNWHPAVVLGLALAVMAQAGGLALQHDTIGKLREENYQLASGKDTNGDKGSILIELNDGARWTDIAELLQAEGLSISASGDFGSLTLRSAKQGADLTAQIDRLRASPLVSSAEPAA